MLCGVLVPAVYIVAVEALVLCVVSLPLGVLTTTDNHVIPCSRSMESVHVVLLHLRSTHSYLGSLVVHRPSPLQHILLVLVLLHALYASRLLVLVVGGDQHQHHGDANSMDGMVGLTSWMLNTKRC